MPVNCFDHHRRSLAGEPPDFSPWRIVAGKALIAILAALLWVGAACGQENDVTIDQQMVSIARVSDRFLIDFFIESYLIPEDSVKELHFIDATGNGFGEEDLIKCFPSERTYYLFPSDTAQKVMNDWQFTSNFQSVTRNVDPQVFRDLGSDKAQNAVLASMLESLNWNYSDLPMKMYFARDSSTVVFDMWGFRPDALQWQPPPPPPSVPQTTYDLMHVMRSDTLIVTDTTYYDQYFIYRTVSDTLIISETEFRERTRRQQIAHQPGLVQPPRKDETLP